MRNIKRLSYFLNQSYAEVKVKYETLCSFIIHDLELAIEEGLTLKEHVDNIEEHLPDFAMNEITKLYF